MWNNFNDYSFGMHSGFGPFFVLLPFIVLWVLIVLGLKGYSLWNAAKRGEMWWFVALLVINTAGILELVYIIFFLKAFPTRKNHHVAHHTHEDPKKE